MYQQVIQFGYPQFLAIMRNGKPFVIRKNGLYEQWYSVTHLRYDIAKLLFTDIDGNDYNYLQCEGDLRELIVLFTFKFKCKKVWFDRRLCWTIQSDQEEFPKYLAFHLRYNQMYLLFSKLRMERLDLENPQADVGVIERPVTLKRTIETDNKIVKERKRVCNNDLTQRKNQVEPFGQVVDGGSTSLRKPNVRVLTELNPIEEPSRSSLSHQITLESTNNLGIEVIIDVLGKTDSDILNLFQENCHNIILCYCYNMTCKGNNYRYNLDRKLLCKEFRRNPTNYSLVDSIDFYKDEKIIVLGTATKFTLYKLEDGNWTKKEYEIPLITLFYRASFGEFAPLSSDQYTIHLTLVGDIKFVFRVKEEVECIKVMLYDWVVWKDLNRNRNFLKTLLYTVADGNILVECNILTKCTKIENELIRKTQLPIFLRHYAEDKMGGFIPIYMDNVKKLNVNYGNYKIDYQNVKIDLIKYREKVIWRREPGESFPKSLIKDFRAFVPKFELQCKDKFIRYKLKGNEFTEEIHQIPPITLLTGDPISNSVQLITDLYNVQLTTHKTCVEFIYTVNPEILCTQIKYSDRVIWNCTPGENKPLYVIYSQVVGMMQVIFEDKIISMVPNSSNLYREIFKIPNEITLHKTNEQDETIKLSLQKYKVQIYKKSGFRYLVNDGVFCTELRHNDIVVWSYTEGEPKPVSFNYFSKRNTISVNYSNKSLHYQLQDNQWILNTYNNSSSNQLIY